jgi:hypothetical protein
MPSYICKKSSKTGLIDLGLLCCIFIVLISRKPVPVIMHTIISSGLISPELISCRRPAIEAAEEDSAKIPSV